MADNLNVREITLNALTKVWEGKRPSHIVLNETIKDFFPSQSKDKNFFVRLFHGTLEYQYQSDYIINLFADLKTPKQKPFIRNILRLSVYQIVHMDKVPDSAAINEAVKIVKKRKFTKLSGFVNAILRKISAGKNEIDLSRRDLKLSIDPKLLKIFDLSIGEKNTDIYLSNSLYKSGVWARNRRRLPENEYDLSDMVFYEKMPDILHDEDFLNGSMIVQDINASMPVRLSGIKKGQTVIDVCAAPGGKSIQAADLMNGSGKVFAFDKSYDKIKLIDDNVKRCELKNIYAEVRDAETFVKEFESIADIVIADLPCSGLGTVSGKPEIKARITFEDIKKLSELQFRILTNVGRYVKKGGKLVFSTCTLTKEEDEYNVERFLNTEKNFKLILQKKIIPLEENGDGFFFAIMERL